MKEQVIIPRNLLTDDILKDEKMSRFVLYLVSRADSDGNVTISLKEIQLLLGFSRQNVRTLIERLKSTTKVTTKPTAKSTTLNIGISTSKALRSTTKSTTKVTTKPTAKKVKETRVGMPDYISPPFVADEMRGIWQEWIEYRKLIKKKYASDKYERMGYEKLLKEANGDYETAKAIIEQSMVFGYQGLFKVKDNGKRIDNFRKGGAAPGSDSEEAARMARLADAVLRVSSDHNKPV